MWLHRVRLPSGLTAVVVSTAGNLDPRVDRSPDSAHDRALLMPHRADELIRRSLRTDLHLYWGRTVGPNAVADL